MKKTIKKFLLSRETLVTLDEQIMNTVKGGVTGYMSCTDVQTSTYCPPPGPAPSTWGGPPCAPSDLRYKFDIKELEGSLQIVNKLQGVSYLWKKEEFPELNFTSSPQVGFIAQELEQQLPQLVVTDASGFKSVDYALLTPVLVEAIKEQQIEIQLLKKKLTQLDEIADVLSKLKAQVIPEYA